MNCDICGLRIKNKKDCTILRNVLICKDCKQDKINFQKNILDLTNKKLSKMTIEEFNEEPKPFTTYKIAKLIYYYKIENTKQAQRFFGFVNA